ncbi:MAG: hypothetical protein ACI9MR_002531, partial [Myxococcota bacterium]
MIPNDICPESAVFREVLPQPGDVREQRVAMRMVATMRAIGFYRFELEVDGLSERTRTILGPRPGTPTRLRVDYGVSTRVSRAMEKARTVTDVVEGKSYEVLVDDAGEIRVVAPGGAAVTHAEAARIRAETAGLTRASLIDRIDPTRAVEPGYSIDIPPELAPRFFNLGIGLTSSRAKATYHGTRTHAGIKRGVFAVEVDVAGSPHMNVAIAGTLKGAVEVEVDTCQRAVSGFEG